MGIEEEFSPDDIAYLEKKFAKIYKDTYEGYTIELQVSRLGAKEIVKDWVAAMMGNRQAINACMKNYSHIISELLAELESDPENLPDPPENLNGQQ